MSPASLVGRAALALTLLVAFAAAQIASPTPSNATALCPAFSLAVSLSPSVMPVDLKMVDLDGDGKLDLVSVADGPNGLVSAFRNTSSGGTLSFGAKQDFTVDEYLSSLAYADFDGDGKPDLAIASSGSGLLSVLRNTSSTGSIRFATPAGFSPNNYPYQVATGDIDGDGKPDLLSLDGSDDPGSVNVLRNTTIGTSISFAMATDTLVGGYPLSLPVADVDGDGRLDVATGDVSNTDSILRNTSTVGNVHFTRTDVNVSANPYPVALADLDGDSKPDLVVGDNLNARPISVLRNTSTSGSVSFALRQTFANSFTTESGFAFADIDGDGKLDVVASTIASGFLVYLNTSTSGSINLASAVQVASGTSTSAVAAGDLDGDGRPDVVLAGDSQLLVYRNTCPPPQASTTTSLTSSSVGNASTYGDSVTLTATVAASGSPTGSVTFKDGAATLGTVPLAASQAAHTLSALSAGSHTLTATYGGNSGFATSTSSNLVQSVAKATLLVQSAGASRAYGASNPTFTPQYAGFVNGDTSSVLGGTPSLTTTATPTTAVGTVPITAAQGTLSSSNYALQYADGQLTITKAPLSVTAQNDSRVYGAMNPTFVATLSGFVNGQNLGTSGVTGAPDVSTTATTISAPGSYAIVPSLGTLASGNYSFAFVDGSLTVSKAATTVTLGSSSPSNLSTYGDSVTFSAEVSLSSGSGTPTGNVAFKDGSTTLSSQLVDASGHATYQTSALGGGAHLLTAVYAGDTNFTGSTSTMLGQAVVQAAPSLTFGPLAGASMAQSPLSLSATASSGLTPTFASSTPSVCTVSGTSLTLVGPGTCTVTASQAGNSNYQAAADVPSSFAVRAPQSITFASPAGGHYGDAPRTLSATADSGLDVTFASHSPGVCTTSGTNGTSLSFAAAGTCSVTASQTGGATYLAATDVTRDFNVATAALTVQANNASRVYGESNPSFDVTSSGFVNGDTATALGGTLTYATMAGPSSAPNTYTITPIGLTSSNYTLTFVPGTLTVTRASSGTLLTPSTTTPSNGEVIQLTAQVGAVAPGAGTPTGQVTFYDGSTPIGTASLDGSGQATTSTTALLDGNSHDLSASYAGDANFASSTAVPLTLAIGQAATQVSLTSSVGSETVFDTPLTLSAQVSVVAPGAGALSGTVTFLDGGAVLGSASVDGLGGASYTTTAGQLAGGAHTLTAQFGGTAVLASSTSSHLALTVDPASTGLTLTSPSTGSVVGQSVTLVASASASSAVTSGTVTFSDGATRLGAASVGTDGQASLTTALLGVGSHTLTATLSASTNFGSAASAPLDLSVAPAATTTMLAAGPTSVTSGSTVSLDVWVSALLPGGGVPSGTVSFLDGASTLGSATLDAGGHASLTLTSLAAGSHTLSASYAGNASNLASSSASTSVAVNQPSSGSHTSSNRPTPIDLGTSGGGGGGGAAPVNPAPVIAPAPSLPAAPAPIQPAPVQPAPIQPAPVPTIAPSTLSQLAGVVQTQAVTPDAVPAGITIEVHAQPPTVDPTASDAQQGSLGGGNAIQLSAPIDLHLVARDDATGAQVALPSDVSAQTFLVSLPVLTQPTDPNQTFAWLVEVQEDGQFLGYMRYPSTLDASSQSLVYQLPADVLQHSSVLPVVLQKAYVQSFQPEVHVWTSPFKTSGDLGVAGPVWTTWEVVAPQVGGRIGVRDPQTGNTLWIDAVGVGPVAPDAATQPAAPVASTPTDTLPTDSPVPDAAPPTVDTVSDPSAATPDPSAAPAPEATADPAAAQPDGATVPTATE